MAEEVVVKDQLTSEMLDAGRALVKELVGVNLSLVCALWLYSSESNRWRLMIATPAADSDGPNKVYSILQEVLASNALRGFKLRLRDIAVASPNTPLVEALRLTVKIPEGSADFRFTRSRANDVYVEDSHILYLR